MIDDKQVTSWCVGVAYECVPYPAGITRDNDLETRTETGLQRPGNDSGASAVADRSAKTAEIEVCWLRNSRQVSLTADLTDFRPVRRR
jgi:hypothetical protein